MRLLKIIISAFYWSRSLSFASKENYREALICLKKSEALRVCIDAEFLLFKGFLLVGLNEDHDAFIVLEKSLGFIEKSRKLNSDEKKYLSSYASKLKRLIDPSYHKLDSEGDFDLSNVARHLQDKFPV